MKQSNKELKCKCCRNILSTDQNDIGFCPKINQQFNNNDLLCKRCFDLINYNKISSYNKVLNEQIKMIFNNYNHYHYYLIIDVFNIPTINCEIINQLPKNINLNIIVNKIDLIDNVIKKYEKLLIDHLIKLNLNIHNILFISAKYEDTFNNLKVLLKQNKNNVFIGYSNVGKSSLIKQLINNQDILVNNKLNTTININEYKLDNFNLIDTPGFIDEQNILNFINEKYYKFIDYKSFKNIKTYQIKYNKTICIENLIYIDLYIKNNKTGSINMYMNNLLKINSYKSLLVNNNFNQNLISYKNNKKLNIIKYESKLNSKITFLLIDGLGLIKFNNIDKVIIKFKNNLKINILK